MRRSHQTLESGSYFLIPVAVRDQFLLKLHTISAKVIGLCPLEAKLSSSIFGKLYAFSVLGAIIITSAVINDLKIYSELSTLTKFETCLNISETLTLTALYVCVLINNIRNSKQWIEPFKNISEFDENC